MMVRQLFDRETWTYTYLVADEDTKQAVIIDPVREQLDRDLRLLRELDLELAYVLETHVHADQVTSAGPLADQTGAKTAVSRLGARCGDIQLEHGDVLTAGDLRIEALATPGHTDDSMSFRVGDEVFTGDTLFIRGTGRSDFQNGDPVQLWNSITQVLFSLPDHARVWPGHDYKGETVSTIGEEKRHNPRLAGKTREQFIEIMNGLDLAPPKRLAESVPANRECGRVSAQS